MPTDAAAGEQDFDDFMRSGSDVGERAGKRCCQYFQRLGLANHYWHLHCF
jgi:hypothetical protein